MLFSRDYLHETLFPDFNILFPDLMIVKMIYFDYNMNVNNNDLFLG